MAQLLLQRDLCAAGAAVDGAPHLGVIPTQLSILRFGLPIFNPLIPSTKPWYMTFKQFQYAWTHTLPLAEQRAACEAVIVPESRRLYRSALSADAKVDWTRSRAPLPIIAGEKVHIFHPAVNKESVERYSKSSSVTDFKIFPRRTHYTVVAGKGWEEVADYALDWLNRQNVLADGITAVIPVTA